MTEQKTLTLFCSFGCDEWNPFCCACMIEAVGNPCKPHVISMDQCYDAWCHTDSMEKAFILHSKLQDRGIKCSLHSVSLWKNEKQVDMKIKIFPKPQKVHVVVIEDDAKVNDIRMVWDPKTLTILDLKNYLDFCITICTPVSQEPGNYILKLADAFGVVVFERGVIYSIDNMVVSNNIVNDDNDGCGRALKHYIELEGNIARERAKNPNHELCFDADDKRLAKTAERLAAGTPYVEEVYVPDIFAESVTSQVLLI